MDRIGDSFGERPPNPRIGVVVKFASGLVAEGQLVREDHETLTIRRGGSEWTIPRGRIDELSRAGDQYST